MSDGMPYLETVERSVDRTDVTVQWARFLGETFGTAGALNCLRYYEDIGWISPLVRDQLTAYLRGLSLDEIHTKRFDEPAALDHPLESLSGTLFSAHARSLEYIATISGDDIEEHVMIAQMAKRRAERHTDGSDRLERTNGADPVPDVVYDE